MMHSAKMLSYTDGQILKTQMECMDYTCGTVLADCISEETDNTQHIFSKAFARDDLVCTMDVEIPYYFAQCSLWYASITTKGTIWHMAMMRSE